jgi:hypothetical protein
VVGSQQTWNDWAKEMFVEVYSQYLQITNNTPDRVKLRRTIDRIKSEGYDGNSGPHKLFIHLNTLRRLGLIALTSSRPRTYQLTDSAVTTSGNLQILLKQLPDVSTLEKIIKSHGWANIAAKVFGIPNVTLFKETAPLEGFVTLLVGFYERTMSTGTPLCSLSTLIDAIQIDLLAKSAELLPYDHATNLISLAQKMHPKEIRFHVDRRGHPAFIKISDSFAAKYSNR